MKSYIKQFILKRLATLPVVLFFASVLIFGIVRIGPGNPVLLVLGRGASDEAIQSMTQQLGLDQPYPVQYIDWMTNVLQGDFGTSLVLKSGTEALPLIISRLQVSLTLGMLALLWAILIAVGAGVLAATHRNELEDYFATSSAILGISMPNYWLGFLLIIVFGVELNVLPTFGYVSPWKQPVTGLQHMLLPSIAMGLPMAAVLTRMLRSELLEKQDANYIEVARAFGLSNNTVFRHYWFSNSLIPLTTVIGIQIRYILGGVVVIEEVFSIPGVGSLLTQALFNFDFPLVQGITILFVTFILLTNLLVDVTYAYLDPRVSYQQ